MGKQTIFGTIKEWLAEKCWKYFLKFSNLTEEEYFRQIKEQESRTDESRPVEKLVSLQNAGEVRLIKQFMWMLQDIYSSKSWLDMQTKTEKKFEHLDDYLMNIHKVESDISILSN